MPLVTKPFSNIITFTRASTGTFTGSNGLIQTATTNTPRFDYDPVTLAAKGLLIEEQRTNLLTYSEQFDNNAAWVKTNSTITANAITAPDGTVVADKLVEDTATSTHQAYQNFVGTVAPYTFSVYAKAGERTVVTLLHGGGNSADYDLVAATATGSGASIAPVGNGWYRCSITQTLPDTVNRSYAVRLNNGSGVTYTGNGTSGLFLWGAQLEAGSFATSYIPTVASQVTRSDDAASVNTLSPWYNAAESSVMVGYQLLPGSALASSATRTAVDITDGSTDNRLAIRALLNASLTDQITIRSGGGAALNFSTNGSAVGESPRVVAAAFRANDFAGSATGATTIATTTGSSMPIGINQMRLGGIFAGTSINQINGWLRNVAYYPRRLSNAELQTLTA